MPFLSQDDNKQSFRVATDEKDFRLEQKVDGYLEYAAQQRELDSAASSKRQYRSFAIIPDIVAIDLLTKYNINVHSPDFLKNPAEVRRFRHIIETEYPKLKTSNVKVV
jgi:hypothetical protein